MSCLVCQASFEGAVCPSCGYDNSTPFAREPANIIAHRQKFQDAVTRYAPDSRVTWREKLPLWLGFGFALALALGFSFVLYKLALAIFARQ